MAVPGTCCGCGYQGAAETACGQRPDGAHCVHWWDGPEGTGCQAPKLISDPAMPEGSAIIIGGPTIYRAALEGDGKGGMFIRLVPDLVAMAKAGRVAVITDIGTEGDDGGD